MKLLVIGGGGREHALAWKLAQSQRVHKVYVAPGNAGTQLENGIENLPITTIPELIKFATNEDIAFTVVGPESPLAEGIVDAFQAAQLKIFGPTQEAAQLETSKNFSKAFMLQHAIPTADYACFTEASAAHAYIDAHPCPLVIKANGLAAGKGVIVATTTEMAHDAIDTLMVEKKLGHAGTEIIIEAFLQGTEVSFMVMADGNHILPLATSQDHKRLLDGDQGPNTGGMGAYSPAPFMTPELHAKVMREIIQPVINGMNESGTPYTGFLYAGLMISPDEQVNVLEFNCRMGDPETQPIMLRLKSDLFTLIEYALNGSLDQIETEWDRRVALGVVLAAEGYPENPRKNDVIHGLPKSDSQKNNEQDFHIFHSGTTLSEKNGHNTIITAGGRVLCATVLGDNMRIAQNNAYQLAKQIKFKGCQMRRDIGYQAVDLQSKK